MVAFRFLAFFSNPSIKEYLLESVSLSSVQAARARIGEAIHVSPCHLSHHLSELTGLPIHLKLENLQRTGSFKERGALNKLLTLSEAERSRGVIAASAGNHAQGVAFHASARGIRAQIVMPLATPQVKVAATRNYGAEVILHGASYDEACEEAQRRHVEEGRTFIHPFDDPEVISGQGTIGLELLEQVPGLEAVVVPIGGGTPRPVAAPSPTTWQGWAPDGKSILFTGERRGKPGIYTIPVAGGEETRVAELPPRCGDAEYSSDGEYIYYGCRSDRSDAREVWRMRADGSQRERVAKGGVGDWFPHVSPDGRLMAFLTSPPHSDFPINLTLVTLRVMSLTDGKIRVLAKLVGGWGTMPLPSWSPDSRRLAFVSYQKVSAGAQPPAPAVVK